MFFKFFTAMLLTLLFALPSQGKAVSLTASDFAGEQWEIRIENGFLTFLSGKGERSQSVAVKPGFEELVRSRQAGGASLPLPDGMAEEYLPFLDDSLTGGAVCGSVGVNRTEIMLLLKLPDGKTRLRIAEWNDQMKLYAFLDNDTVPGVSWFDTVHFGDGEISLHWLADGIKMDAPVAEFAAAERNAVITRDRHGTWWVRSMTEFGQTDNSYTLGWNYIVDNDLRKIGSNDGFLFGSYIWNYFEYIDFVALCHETDALKAAFEQTSGQWAQWAVVSNPDPDDRLHLRTEPDRNAESLGKFYNRTPVWVLESRGNWSHVQIGSENILEGWMMTRYLAFGEEMDRVACAFPSRRGLVFQEESIAHPVFASPDLNALSTWEAQGTPDEFIIGVYGDTWFLVMNREGQTGYVPMEWYKDGNG